MMELFYIFYFIYKNLISALSCIILYSIIFIKHFLSAVHRFLWIKEFYKFNTKYIVKKKNIVKILKFFFELSKKKKKFEN